MVLAYQLPVSFADVVQGSSSRYSKHQDLSKASPDDLEVEEGFLECAE